MSDDNFEAFNNASLRKKCLEYGLPNVPITDTSRKLLIRKLRAAISGETAGKNKNRSKTIHVTKIPSPVETANAQEEEAPKRPPSRINRRTIAATSVTSTANKNKNRRKTIHVTKIPSPVETANVQEKEASKRPPSRINRRTIASATSVTSTVDDTTLPTTSVSDRRRSVRSQPDFGAPVRIPVSKKRKTAIVLEQQTKEVVTPSRSVSLSRTGVAITSYFPNDNNVFVSQYTSTYEPITHPVAQPHKPQDTTYGLSSRKVLVEPDRTSSYRTVAVNRTSIEPEPIYKPSLPVPRYLDSRDSANTSSQSSTTTRRLTTGGNGSATGPQSKYEDNEPETPYLSDFARKLQPLGKGVESPRNIPIQRVMGRRSTRQQSSVASNCTAKRLRKDIGK